MWERQRRLILVPTPAATIPFLFFIPPFLVLLRSQASPSSLLSPYTTSYTDVSHSNQSALSRVSKPFPSSSSSRPRYILFFSHSFWPFVSKQGADLFACLPVSLPTSSLSLFSHSLVLSHVPTGIIFWYALIPPFSLPKIKFTFPYIFSLSALSKIHPDDGGYSVVKIMDFFPNSYSYNCVEFSYNFTDGPLHSHEMWEIKASLEAKSNCACTSQ